MTEIALRNQSEFSHFKPKEQTFIRRKIQNIAKRVMQFVRKPINERHVPEQLINPKGLIKKEKQRNPERARRIDEEGCAVRSIISAVAHATKEKNINATAEEWDKRFQQIRSGEVTKDEVDQQLSKLYAEYALNNTPLGNALKQVHVNFHQKETLDNIKARIRSGEQVIIISKDYIHMFHASLDKKGHLISLSDQKKRTVSGKKRYMRFKYSDGEYTTFSVTRK